MTSRTRIENCHKRQFFFCVFQMPSLSNCPHGEDGRYMEEYEDDVEADMEFCEEPSEEECIETNMGKMPIGDYREIFAMQHGFDSYEELCEYCKKEENKE